MSLTMPLTTPLEATPVEAQCQSVHEDVERVLIDERALRARIRELGHLIEQHYRGQDLLLVAVLKGSFVFMADLIRCIEMPHHVDFMATQSYGTSTESSGAVQILKDLKQPIKGRNVLLVEDIIDSGHTLNYLMRLLQNREPASLRIMTLLDKPERREVDIAVDWVGFEIPNEFVIGYGLDYGEVYRNLPYIGILKPSVYSE